jgi:hypothetical protein
MARTFAALLQFVLAVSIPSLAIACATEDKCAQLAKVIATTDCVHAEQEILAALEAARTYFPPPAKPNAAQTPLLRSFDAVLQNASSIAITCATKHRHDLSSDLRLKVVGAYPPVQSWLSFYLRQEPNASIRTDAFFLKQGSSNYEALLSAYRALVSKQ